jgi:hypothetical protein
MDKPKKTKVEVIKYVRVKVLLASTSPSPSQNLLGSRASWHLSPVPASPYDHDIIFAKGVVSDYEWYGRRSKAILAKVSRGERHCRARMDALGRVPKLASAYMRRKLHAERN